MRRQHEKTSCHRNKYFNQKNSYWPDTITVVVLHIHCQGHTFPRNLVHIFDLVCVQPYTFFVEQTDLLVCVYSVLPVELQSAQPSDVRSYQTHSCMSHSEHISNVILFMLSAIPVIFSNETTSCQFVLKLHATCGIDHTESFNMARTLSSMIHTPSHTD